MSQFLDGIIIVDEMPKDGINMVERFSHITEMQKFDQIEYSHNPFYFILECSYFFMKKTLSLILIFLKDVMKITSLNRGLEWFHKRYEIF